MSHVNASTQLYVYLMFYYDEELATVLENKVL